MSVWQKLREAIKKKKKGNQSALSRTRQRENTKAHKKNESETASNIKKEEIKKKKKGECERVEQMSESVKEAWPARGKKKRREQDEKGEERRVGSGASWSETSFFRLAQTSWLIFIKRDSNRIYLLSADKLSFKS